MLLFQFQIFWKVCFVRLLSRCIFATKFSNFLLCRSTHGLPCYLVTQAIHFITHQFHTSELLYQVLVDRDFGLGRCSGGSLEQILSPSSFPIFTLIPSLLLDLEGFCLEI